MQAGLVTYGLRITDGYRSIDGQTRAVLRKPDKAIPRSLHLLGLAADVEVRPGGSSRAIEEFAKNTPGLVRPRPDEPWHFQLDRGLTREESSLLDYAAGEVKSRLGAGA